MVCLHSILQSHDAAFYAVKMGIYYGSYSTQHGSKSVAFHKKLYALFVSVQLPLLSSPLSLWMKEMNLHKSACILEEKA